MSSLYFTTVFLKALVLSMLSIFSSYGLMLLISFTDVIRMLVAEEVETRVKEARQ